MNKLRQMILKMGENISYGLFSIIIIYLFLLSIFITCYMVYTDEHVYYVKEFPLLMVIGLAGICGLGALRIGKREKRGICLQEPLLKRITIGATGILALFLTGMILSLKLVPIYDQSAVYYAAGKLLSGDYSPWKMGEYYSMLPYQNGMVLMMCPFVALFGESAYLAIQIWNIPMMLLSYWGIGKIMAMQWGHKWKYYTYLGLLSVIPMWTYVTYVYGTLTSLCLSIWCVYLVLRFEKTHRWKDMLGAGVCMFFAILCKSNAEIILIAVCIMLLLHGLRTGSLKPLGAVGILLAFALAEIKGIPLLMHLWTGEVTNQGIPMIAWLAMGLQESGIAPGWYNEFPMNLYRHVSPQQEVIKREVYNSFQESFALFARDKEYMMRFFARKTASMWADPAYQAFTAVNTKNLFAQMSYITKDIFYNGGIANTILYLVMDVQQTILYFGTVLFLILKKRAYKLENAHLIVVFLGGFLFHFIGEAKSNYVLSYYILLVPYAIRGYHVACQKLAGLRWKSSHFRIIGILLALFLVLLCAKGPLIKNTLKIDTDTADYIWFCQNQTQWKAQDYKKV